MGNIVKKLQKSSIVFYIAIFALFFLAACRYAHGAYFGTDELDIMVGGKSIASGYRLYNDFTSQHMPISYYISAFFDLIGFKTAASQRMCFYAFYALIWTVALARFRSKIGTRALILYPLLSICLTLTYDMGHAVMSEHLAGLGFVLLYLEFIEYYDTCELKFVDCILISVSILLSFGTIFIAAFGIAAIAVGVFVRDIQFSAESGRSFGKGAAHVTVNALKAVIAVAIPWIGLLAYYAMIGSLKMFYRAAYVVNTQYYTKYNGLGESTFGAFLSGFNSVWGTLGGSFALDGFTYRNVVYFIVIVLVIHFLMREWKNRGPLFVVITVLFISFMSSRGIYSYHGTHVVAVLALISAIDLDYVCTEFQKSAGVKRTVLSVVLIFSFLTFSISFMSGVSSYAIKEKNKIGKRAKIVAATTEPDEAIAVLILDNGISMNADRPMILNAACTPWTWKGLRQTEMENWMDHPPRVIAFGPDAYVWDENNPIKKYAPKLVSYIEENYTCYGYAIYFRNDYYEEAEKLASAVVKKPESEDGS